MKLLCLTLLWIANESATQSYTEPDYPHMELQNHLFERLNYSSTSIHKICIKQYIDSKSKHDAIKIDAKDFKDLVRHSDIYVDKSLFIRPIIMSNQSLISFTYPRKWGKSINLDMVKTFLEIEVDSEGKPLPIKSTWSYQYFQEGKIILENGDSVALERPPYIYRHKNHIKRFLARYPVIYLDLSAAQPTSNDLDGFFQAFRNAIATAFKKHEYLAKVLGQKKQKKKTFEKYIKGENRGTEEMINSLQFLRELLFDQFKKNVFVFIDGYDYMIEQAFFTVPSRIELNDAEKFLDFYSKFLHSTFEDHKDHVRTGVLTGVFNVDHCFEKNRLKDIVNYNMLNKNLEPFQGFTIQEVEQLYHELDIPAKQIKEMFDWHSGYHLGDQCDHPKVKVFNSWLIVNFANTRKLEKSWAKIWSHDILPKTLKLKSTRKLFQAVISGSADATIDRNTSVLNIDDIKFLKSVTTDKDHNAPSNRFTSIFILFYAAGYFSLDIESAHASCLKELPTVIPCKGTLSIIVEELKNYYREKFGDSACISAERVARGLVTLLHRKFGLNRMLFLPLDNLYRRIPHVFFIIDGQQETIDEANFLALLYVKSKYNFNIGLNVLYYDDKKKPQTIYMTLYNNDFGVAFSYRYKTTTFDNDGDFEELNYHEFFFRSKHVKMIRGGVLQMALPNDIFNVTLSNIAFGDCLVWSETEKKFIPTKRWSYNLAVFKDFYAGRERDSSDSDASLY